MTDLLEIIRDVVSISAILVGLFFVVVGAVGVLRLPDFYTRLHAAGMTDTLGAELVIVGLIIRSGFTLDSAKLLLIGAFLLITSPTSTHAIANAAHASGLKPLLGRFRPARPGEQAPSSEQDEGDQP